MAGWVRRRLGVNCFYTLLRSLDDASGAAERPSCLHYRLLGKEELLALCLDPELDLRPSRVQAALSRGEQCVGALDDAGRLAGYMWHAFETAPHVRGIRVHFGPRLRYAYKVYVRPACRGRGIARELLARGAQRCPRHGRTHGLSFVALDNGPSLRAFSAAGWRIAGYAGYIEWFGAFRAFASPGAARLGAGFVRT